MVDVTSKGHEKCPSRSKQQVIVLSEEKSYKLTSGSKSVYSVLDELISYSFLIFLSKVGAEFLNFLTGQILASLNQLLIKKVAVDVFCIRTSNFDEVWLCS